MNVPYVDSLPRSVIVFLEKIIAMRQNLRIFEFDAQKETWAGATSPQNIKLLFLELQVVREGALIHNLKPFNYAKTTWVLR